MTAPHSRDVPAHRRAATHSDLNQKVSYGSPILDVNGNVGESFYMSSLHNRFFLGDRRWDVSAKNVVGTVETPVPNVSRIFDGNYEAWLVVPEGGHLEINMGFDSEPGGWYQGYSYGRFVVVFYTYNHATPEVDVQVYSTYSVPEGHWYTLPKEKLSSRSYTFDCRQYRVEDIRLTVRGAAAGSGELVWLSQFEFYNDRVQGNPSPVLLKYRPEVLYERVSWQGADREITAYIDKDGTAEFGRLRSAAGSTANRPTGVAVGTQYFDTTIMRPIWYAGSGNWINATGTAV